MHCWKSGSGVGGKPLVAQTLLENTIFGWPLVPKYLDIETKRIPRKKRSRIELKKDLGGRACMGF